jgi:hypothetical protein
MARGGCSACSRSRREDERVRPWYARAGRGEQARRAGSNGVPDRSAPAFASRRAPGRRAHELESHRHAADRAPRSLPPRTTGAHVDRRDVEEANRQTRYPPGRCQPLHEAAFTPCHGGPPAKRPVTEVTTPCAWAEEDDAVGRRRVAVVRAEGAPSWPTSTTPRTAAVLRARRAAASATWSRRAGTGQRTIHQAQTTDRIARVPDDATSIAARPGGRGARRRAPARGARSARGPRAVAPGCPGHPRRRRG